jgi:integrase
MLEEITNRLYTRAKWLGLASELRLTFGLRAKESLLSHEIRDGCLIINGTKGGRPRNVPIETDFQRSLVSRVQDYIRQKNQSSLIPNGKTLKQAMKAQSNALQRVGAKKENATHAHAMRHRFAQEMARSGASKSEISETLGHGREEIVAHYVK